MRVRRLHTAALERDAYDCTYYIQHSALSLKGLNHDLAVGHVIAGDIAAALLLLWGVLSGVTSISVLDMSSVIGMSTCCCHV